MRALVVAAIGIACAGCVVDIAALRHGRVDGGPVEPDGGPPPEDAGPQYDGGTCAVACETGRFCDGVQSCDWADPLHDADGCVDGPDPCGTGQNCNENDDTCMACPDADGDGHYGPPCDDDCDDADAERRPGNPETCDASDHDEDCDCSTVGTNLDADSDTYVSNDCCNCVGMTGETCGPDCNDADDTIHPTATETPGDTIDSNCNGSDDT